MKFVAFLFLLLFTTILDTGALAQSQAKTTSDSSNHYKESFRFPYLLTDASFSFTHWSLHGYLKIKQSESSAVYLGMGYSKSFAGLDNLTGIEVDPPPFDWWRREEDFEQRPHVLSGDIIFSLSNGIVLGGGIEWAPTEIYQVYYSTASGLYFTIHDRREDLFGVNAGVGYMLFDKTGFYLMLNYSTIRDFNLGIGITFR